MRDLVFLALVGGFFALAAAYIRGCAAVVGQGELSGPDAGEPEADIDAEVAT